MSRPKNTQLNQLLFSSHNEDNDNHSQDHSYDEDIEQCEQNFLYHVTNDDHWRSSQNLETHLMHVNGPSIQFSQNYSQNSMMLSHKHDEESREYRLDQNNKYLKILEDKKVEEIQFNQALDRELTSVKQELEKSKFQVTKLQALIKGFEVKIKKKEEEIGSLEQNINELENEIGKLKTQKAECFQRLSKKDDFFKQHLGQTTKIVSKLNEKEKENSELQEMVDSLQNKIAQLEEALSVYNGSDRRLTDYRGYGGYESSPGKKNAQIENNDMDRLKKEKSSLQKEKSTLQKKNSNLQKEKANLEKEKVSLQIEFSAVRDKLEDRQSRFKASEDDTRKKIALKDRKVQQLEQKLADHKEDQLKTKTQYEINIQKLQTNLTTKNKQLTSLNDKLTECEKRIKSLFEQSKKKDERIRDIGIETLEKGKALNLKEKEMEEMRIKQQFDQHMHEEKDLAIEKLEEQKRSLRAQLETDRNERTEKTEKTDKNERARKDKQIEKLKKELQVAKKTADKIEKERDQTTEAHKDCKKKIEEVNKKCQQLKSHSNQLEQQLKNTNESVQKQKETADKLLKEQTDYKKRADTIPQLRNKIIILQSRLKQNQSLYRQNNDLTESLNFQDKLDALEARLQQKQRENRRLKNELRTTATQQTGDNHYQDLETLQLELIDKQNTIDKLSEELDEKDKLIEQMKRELEFKDHTLDYTHKILVNSEKAKIELEQEKMMLEEMVQKASHQNSFEDNHEQIRQFYEAKIHTLQERIQQLERRVREKQQAERTSREESKFENRQLKERIRELNEMLLSKQRKIAPETMSQDDTAVFLLKTMKRVAKSEDMMRILAKNTQFKEVFSRIERQLKK